MGGSGRKQEKTAHGAAYCCSGPDLLKVGRPDRAKGQILAVPDWTMRHRRARAANCSKCLFVPPGGGARKGARGFCVNSRPSSSSPSDKAVAHRYRGRVGGKRGRERGACTERQQAENSLVWWQTYPDMLLMSAVSRVLPSRSIPDTVENDCCWQAVRKFWSTAACASTATVPGQALAVRRVWGLTACSIAVEGRRGRKNKKGGGCSPFRAPARGLPQGARFQGCRSGRRQCCGFPPSRGWRTTGTAACRMSHARSTSALLRAPRSTPHTGRRR